MHSHTSVFLLYESAHDFLFSRRLPLLVYLTCPAYIPERRPILLAIITRMTLTNCLKTLHMCCLVSVTPSPASSGLWGSYIDDCLDLGSCK